MCTFFQELKSDEMRDQDIELLAVHSEKMYT